MVQGRGSNRWLSSKGCLQFTMILHHTQSKTLTLLQHLVGVAMVEAILSKSGYEKLPIKLKWPNDLYTIAGPESEMKKLGGILVNSQTIRDGFLLLIGFGINVYDTPWTRSLNDLIEMQSKERGIVLEPWTKEGLLACFCRKFEELYLAMHHSGFPYDLYYRHWLHSGQVVFLEQENMEVRIEGIDKSGFLMARSCNTLTNQRTTEDAFQERIFLLEPDGNSFDMMKNLINRKL